MDTSHCDCGLSYVEDSLSDCELHEAHHDQFVNGIHIPAIQRLRPDADVLGYWLYLSTRETPRIPRKELSEAAYFVSMVLNLPVGHDGSDQVENVLYLLGREDRVIGLAIVGESEFPYRLQWCEHGRSFFTAREPASPRPCIGRLWVAKSLQRHGIASALVQVIATRLGTTPENMAYETPFTPSGEELVRSLTPNHWYGSGDWTGFEKHVCHEHPPPAVT